MKPARASAKEKKNEERRGEERKRKVKVKTAVSLLTNSLVQGKNWLYQDFKEFHR